MITIITKVYSLTIRGLIVIDYHKYVGYCRPDEKEKNRWEGGGGRWDEEKPVENKPVESGGDYSTNSSIRSRDTNHYA